MAMFQLNAASGGINRQRIKGGPKPDNLYDILNGYVDDSGAVVSRPGVVQQHDLPAGTIGMCAFAGGLVVFSHVVVGAAPAGVTVEVLPHPLDVNDVPLREIHYAGPFLGSLYVTAEFEDGVVCDYWLETAETWQANRNYLPDALVQPTTPNGYAYRASRTGSPGVVWAAGVERAVGDVVEPRVFNGFEYVCIEAEGSPPRSGATEPNWPAAAGAIMIEEADVDLAPPSSQQQPPGSAVPPRYTNPGGSVPSGGGNNDFPQEIR